MGGLIQLQFSNHIELRLRCICRLLLIPGLLRVYLNRFFRLEGLELDGIGSGLRGNVYELFGKFKAAIVIHTGFGNDKGFIIVHSW